VSENRGGGDRRLSDRRAPSEGRALVPAGPARTETPDPPTPAADAAAFAAQVIGQTGQRKGLKGGPPVLDAARSTYLGAEYSGARERRPKPGGVTKTKI
jgi:hypothetical protein